MGGDVVDYDGFLLHIKKYFNIIRICDYKNEKGVCLLRHDVDHDIDMAIEMGKIENNLGIHSTFFMLHTSEYYGEKDFINKCKVLTNLGHEVGLHNNILTFCLENKKLPISIFRREIRYLRGNGIRIYGTSSHGDALCRKLDFRNYEIFKGCVPKYKKNKMEQIDNIKLHSINLLDYGLYEAYFLQRDYYLSDSGKGKWHFWIDEDDEWNGRIRDKEDVDFYKFIKDLKGDSVIQVATHPKYWRDNI